MYGRQVSAVSFKYAEHDASKYLFGRVAPTAIDTCTVCAHLLTHSHPAIGLSLTCASPGCTIAELALGCLFFPTKSTKEHLAMIEKKVGRFPEHMLFGENNGTHCFDRTSNRHKMGSILKSESLDYVENECHPLQDELPDDAMESGLYDLLSTVLTIDPQERPNAKEALVLAKKIVEVEEE